MIPPLPAQSLWLPYEAGPYRMAMGLTAVPESDWFEIDGQYPTEMAERARLLTTQHADVFGVTEGAEAACAEAARMILDHLTDVHPGWFRREGGSIRVMPTGETLTVGAFHPLELAGRLVQEDLCLIQMDRAGPRLTAAVLCFPSRWRLHEKLGLPLAEVHGAVPMYADRLARPVDRFMAHIRDGHIAARVNWSIVDDPTLFQPMGKWRSAEDVSITPDNAADRLFLRVERQTLRRLPATGAVLFGIRVHVYPLPRVVAVPGAAGRLAAAIRALPPEMALYKSLPVYQGALLTWLDQLPR